ncbi:MAG: hypothetical protein P8Y17_01355 [Patescibacteria group bacterium]
MRFKEVFRRIQSGKKEFRRRLIQRLDQLHLELPNVSVNASKIYLRRESTSTDLLKLLSISPNGDPMKLVGEVNFSKSQKIDGEERLLIARLDSGENYAIINVLGQRISVKSNCPALVDGRNKNHHWRLLEEIVKSGEKVVRLRRESYGGTSPF